MPTLELVIRDLTTPIGGQYPRPWMTDLPDPASANIFIVGANQATAYPEALVGSHQRFLDALFNRNGESCRAMYAEVRAAEGKRARSPARRNIEALTAALAARAGARVLETNVVCYSTPMSADLSRPEHHVGRDRGRELFRAVLEEIDPPVLIAHGAAPRKALGRALAARLPNRGWGHAGEVVGPRHVYLIPSLAPPGWNRWQRHAAAVFQELAAAVADDLRS